MSQRRRTELQNIGAPAASPQQAGLRAAACARSATRVACWLRASRAAGQRGFHRTPARPGRGTTSPTTPCGPARRVSLETGSAKKAEQARSNEDLVLRFVEGPAVARESSCRPRRRSSGPAPTRWSTRSAGSKRASPSGSSNSADANRLLDRREHLRRLDVPEGLFHGITRLRRQGERYFADGLRELPDNRRLAILAVCRRVGDVFSPTRWWRPTTGSSAERIAKPPGSSGTKCPRSASRSGCFGEASRADWPRPAGCGRHQRRREPTAQRLSDVALAAGPRQPDVAGAERVPQVEQHRRLPEAVVGLGAQQPEPVGRVPSLFPRVSGTIVKCVRLQRR